MGHTANLVRFGLTKLPFKTEEGMQADQMSQVFVITEIPSDLDFVERFETDQFKGMKLRSKEVQSSNSDSFAMM